MLMLIVNKDNHVLGYPVILSFSEESREEYAFGILLSLALNQDDRRRNGDSFFSIGQLNYR